MKDYAQLDGRFNSKQLELYAAIESLEFSGLLFNYPSQFLPQVHGHLTDYEFAKSFRASTLGLSSRPALLVKRPSLGAYHRSHVGPITALLLTPEGQLASFSWDGVRIWDIGSCKTTVKLDSPSYVTAAAALEDGKVVLGDKSGKVGLHDTTLKCIHRPRWVHEKAVKALAALPDDRLVSLSADGTVIIGQLELTYENKLERIEKRGLFKFRREVYRQHPVQILSWTAKVEGCGKVNAIALLPDGNLALGSDSGMLHLWNVTSWSETARLDGGRSINALAPLSDGRRLAVSCDAVLGENNIFIADIETWSKVKSFGYAGYALLPLPRGHLAIDEGHQIGIWELESGARIAELWFERNLSCLLALPNAGLVAGDYNGNVHWLEITGYPQLGNAKGHVLDARNSCA